MPRMPAQCHTNLRQNARVERFYGSSTDGFLVINGRHHPGGWACSNVLAGASSTEYTSARLVTRGKAAFRYKGLAGSNATTPLRMDVRVKLPVGEAGARSRQSVWDVGHRQGTVVVGEG